MGKAATDPAGTRMLVGRGTETAILERLVSDARRGEGRVLVVEGEPGIGKTALLEFAETAAAGMQIARAAGVRPEADIPYSGLHQLLRPFHEGLDRIPDAHRHALEAAFGLTSARPRDRFFVGMAALALLSDAALRHPVLCVIDDAHHLDRASIDALGFTARRVLADPLAFIFAVRGPEEPVAALQGLDRVRLSGLDADAARELIASTAGARVDPAVAARIVADTHRHPLAIIELVRGLSRAQLEGLAPLPELLPLGGRLEDLFVARVQALPADLRTWLLVAAADPSGDVALVSSAAGRLGLTPGSGHLPPELSDFVSCSPRILFRHSLMRSAAYYAASSAHRRRAHEALAAASDPARDSDRRAWHLAAAASEPDEAIASALERSAERARARGGWAGAASILERAAELTPDGVDRADRSLATAHAWLLAGQPGAARSSVRLATPTLTCRASRRRAIWLEGMIDFTSGRPAEASSALLMAARMAADDDPRAARDTLLDAFDAAHLAGVFADVGVEQVLAAVGGVELDGATPTVGDALLDGFATLLDAGDADGVPILRGVLDALPPDQPITDEELAWLPIAWIAAGELYDDRTWRALTARWATAARMHGSVVALPIGLGRVPHFDVVVGRFSAAERMVEEARDLAAATHGAARPGGHATAALTALAWRGRGVEARAAAETLVTELTSLGRGTGVRMVHLALTILELGLGNYRAALRAARKASVDDRLLHLNAGPEVIEAAVRCGEPDLARSALERLRARVEAAPTDWGVGVLVRCEALVAEPEDAEELYRSAISHLSRTLVLPQLGRAHLLYGEWLRRQRRRRDAREQLRTAFELLGDLGAEAFAERARAELMATGEHARRRVVATLDQLTPQEEQVARLAGEGASNTDIAMQLFISVPTVVYHLQKAFRKLDVANRRSLARALDQRDHAPDARDGPTG